MNKNIKIVIDCRMHHLSGIGRYIKDLVPGICEAFQNVILFGDSQALFSYTNTYPHVKLVDDNSPIYSIKEQWAFITKIPSCDIFWSPHYNVPMLPIKAKHKVVTIHDANHLAFYKQLSLPQKIYAKLFYNGALNKSDKVITISEFSKKELIKYTSVKYEKKIKVIYRFVGDIINKNNTLDIVNTKTPYFLFVGNVKPSKNIKRALEAFKRLIADKVDGIESKLIFKIVGKKDGFISGEEGIQDIVENDEQLKNRIEFTGHISDGELENLYRNATCMVFPSLYEGFGLPPLEAMIFGCPTITSNAASLPEVCGDATLYFNPYNIDDIKDKMMIIANSSSIRKELIEKGFVQVKKFNKEDAVNDHVILFESIVL